jgi:hypothetical protein
MSNDGCTNHDKQLQETQQANQAKQSNGAQSKAKHGNNTMLHQHLHHLNTKIWNSLPWIDLCAS